MQRLMQIEHQLNLLHRITVTEAYSLITQLSTKTHYEHQFTVKLAIFVTFNAEYNITGNLLIFQEEDYDDNIAGKQKLSLRADFH
jgi:hypothetical protein